MLICDQSKFLNLSILIYVAYVSGFTLGLLFLITNR